MWLPIRQPKGTDIGNYAAFKENQNQYLIVRYKAEWWPYLMH